MSPAKKSARKSAGRKKPAGRKARAPKRAGKKKPVARKAPKRAVKKKPVARKARARKPVAKRAAKKTALKLVMRPKPAKARRPAARPFAGAMASASAKDLALFDLVRARVELSAAVQGMTAASAEVPIAEGKWSPRQVVLHVYYWDREMLPWIEKTYQRGVRPPHTMDDILAENESSQRELAGHDWETAKRMLQQAREALIEALQSLPEEPAELWTSEHPLGWLVRILSKHDRHHAGRLKEARAGGTPSETASHT